MFELRPYNRRNALAARDPFRELENLEREFFGMNPFGYSRMKATLSLSRRIFPDLKRKISTSK